MALLVPMLLSNGGYGYENCIRLFPALSVEHRLRSRFRPARDASRTPNADNWPPYDIARTGEDAYRITMAVAGIGQDGQAMARLDTGNRKAGLGQMMVQPFRRRAGFKSDKIEVGLPEA